LSTQSCGNVTVSSDNFLWDQARSKRSSPPQVQRAISDIESSAGVVEPERDSESARESIGSGIGLISTAALGLLLLRDRPGGA